MHDEVENTIEYSVDGLSMFWILWNVVIILFGVHFINHICLSNERGAPHNITS